MTPDSFDLPAALSDWTGRGAVVVERRPRAGCAPQASRSPAGRGKVYIFDGVDADDDTGDAPTMNARVAACYAWAEHHGLAVLDEIISWPPRRHPDRTRALATAIAACRRDNAALLVHSPAVLPDNPSARHELDPLPLWTIT
jgi:hypothetical protein